MLSKINKGYRVIDGKVYNSSGCCLKTSSSGNRPYHRFSISFNGRPKSVPVHRLVAYQKYGDRLFEKRIQVRHLDNNKLNNLPLHFNKEVK